MILILFTILLIVLSYMKGLDDGSKLLQGDKSSLLKELDRIEEKLNKD